MNLSKALGCMIASASGDSLGAAVEFMTRSMILENHGNGVRELMPYYGQPAGVITDDTQQAIAVGTGLIKAKKLGPINERIISCVWAELKKWVLTQSDDTQNRAPGNNSLHALSFDEPGTFADPTTLANSCGSLMRVHPVGILFAGNSQRAAEVGRIVSALTHGGEEAMAACALQAKLISRVCSGEKLQTVIASLNTEEDPELLKLPRTCQALATDLRVHETYWQGWDADEALAMSILVCRQHPDNLLNALSEGVTQDGDSDSIGTIAGALLGADLGIETVDPEWVEIIERRDELEHIARTLANV